MRLFFALWPDEPLRQSVQDIIRCLKPSCPARWIHAEQLHMTLAFLGDVGPESLDRLAQVGSILNGECLSFVLDRLEWWPRPGVLCLVPTTEPKGLVALADGLAAHLRESGFSLERRTFRPHLTLARRASQCPSYDWSGSKPLIWRPRSVSLVQSRHDEGVSRYQILGAWPLLEAPDLEFDENSETYFDKLDGGGG